MTEHVFHSFAGHVMSCPVTETYGMIIYTSFLQGNIACIEIDKY
jgi:hypothetical protein